MSQLRPNYQTVILNSSQYTHEKNELLASSGHLMLGAHPSDGENEEW